MSNILISGLVNTETTVKVRKFPIPYYPIDYPFFGVQSAVSGVAYNIACALTALGDSVKLVSMTGKDFTAKYIKDQLHASGIGTKHIKSVLQETPASVVLYDEEGKRQIYCDLKDIQETHYDFSKDICEGLDLVIACNINFNRDLLRIAKGAGIPIATDVHVLSQVWDDYNREFMEYADILFLSDEGLGENYSDFLWELAYTYGSQIIVLGRGSRGAAMYWREENRLIELPAFSVEQVVNTVGAGDALFSSFLHYYLKGYSPVDCLIRAQLFASVKIGVSGASKGFVTEEEIERLKQIYCP